MDSEATLETPAGLDAVTVETPSRLHLGFVDLHGGLGRRFGSLGLGLAGIATRVHVDRDAALTVEGLEADRVTRVARELGSAVGKVPRARIRVEKTIPGHIGLGSGTQLALAVGVALNRLYGWGLTVSEVAEIADRGARSGMGVGAFCHGGFFVDGGKGPDGAIPPVVAQAPFPEPWRVLLVFDEAGEGLHGEAEQEAFRTLPPFPEADAGHIARLVLMRILPAVKEWDIHRFGQGIGEVQAIIGDYFASAQGGRYTSPRVAEVMEWLQRQGVAGVGQSSWGPTGFAMFGDANQAAWYQQAIQAQFRDSPGLHTAIVAGGHSGARIREIPYGEA